MTWDEVVNEAGHGGQTCRWCQEQQVADTAVVLAWSWMCTAKGFGLAPGMKLFMKLAMLKSVPVVSRKSTYRNVSIASHSCGAWDGLSDRVREQSPGSGSS